jgi:[ribosomal protein S5]-alanine N-acetyltransferase
MIETERLILKPLSLNELKKYADSPSELAKELNLTATQSLLDDETREAITRDLLPNMESGKDPVFYSMWIVIEKSKKAIAGAFCFHSEPDEKGEVEIGYGTDYEYRNIGIMTETIAGIIQWIKTNKQIRTIRAETDYKNISSIRVLEKNNFRVFQYNNEKVILKLKVG